MLYHHSFISSAVCALEFFFMRAILHHLRRNNVRKLTSSETKANGGERKKTENCLSCITVQWSDQCARCETAKELCCAVLCDVGGELWLGCGRLTSTVVALWQKPSSPVAPTRSFTRSTDVSCKLMKSCKFFLLLLHCSQFCNVAFLLRTPFPSLSALTHFPPHWSKSRVGIKIFEPVCRHSLCNGKRRRLSDAFFKYHSSLAGWN